MEKTKNSMLINVLTIGGLLSLGSTFACCFATHPGLRWIYALLCVGIGGLIVAQLVSSAVRVLPTKYAAVALVCCTIACFGSFGMKMHRDEKRLELTKLIERAEAAHAAGDLEKAFAEIDKADVSSMRDLPESKRAAELLAEYRKPIDEKRERFQKEQREAAQAKKMMEENDKAESEAAAKVAVSRFGPKPENSAWDGSVRAVTKYVNENFNDPDVEYISWSDVFHTDSSWAVTVKLRAKNSLGAKIVVSKIFFIRDGKVTSMVDK